MKQRLYRCRIYNQMKRVQCCYLIDSSVDNVHNYLLKNHSIVLSIQPVSRLRSGWFKSKDLLLISQQLHALLKSGIPLIESLSLLIQQQSSRHWQAVLIKINELVQEGHLFSEALAYFPSVFPAFYLEMIKTSDDSGQLILCQECIIIILTKQLYLKKKLITGLRYPLFLLVTLFIVVALITQLLLPQFQHIYSSFCAELPLLTRLLLQLSTGMQHHIETIGFFSAAIVIFAYYSCYARPFYLCQLALLKLPLINKLIQTHYLHYLFQHLALTEKAALPLLTALTVAKNRTRFLPYQKELAICVFALEQGQLLSTIGKDLTLFPPLCYAYLRIGEESCSFVNIFAKLQEYYQNQLENMLENIVTLIEPLFMIFLCLIIGILMLALYLPIINLGDILI